MSAKTAPTFLDCHPDCPASLSTLKISVPPAVKLAAVEHVRQAPDPDVIAQEIVEDLQAALAQFAEIANGLNR